MGESRRTPATPWDLTPPRQSSTLLEIGRAAAQAASGTDDAARHAVGVWEGAERTGLSTEVLRSASRDMSVQAVSMRSKVDSFLTGLRAA